MTILSIIFFVIIGFQLFKWFVVKILPRILMWQMRRRMEHQMRDAFGQQASGRQRRASNSYGWGQSQSQQHRQQQQQQQGRRRGKIIGEDVGEYVEFEEVATFTSSAETQSPKDKKHYKEEPQISDADWEDIK